MKVEFCLDTNSKCVNTSCVQNFQDQIVLNNSNLHHYSKSGLKNECQQSLDIRLCWPLSLTKKIKNDDWWWFDTVHALKKILCQIDNINEMFCIK
jgi:hypothetical protein